MKKGIFLSVVIPAFNEAENFKKGCLDRVAQYLKKQRYSWEVILVDDGSTDKTPALLKRFVKANKGFDYIRIPHGGKLAAIYAGVMATKGRYVLFTDFDQSTPLKEVKKMWPEFEKGAAVVIANRYGKGAERRNDSLISWVRSQIFRRLAQLLVGREIKDPQCGFKAFKTAVARDLFQSLKIHKVKKIKKSFMGAFDLELLFIAQKKGLKIVSVPVIWYRVKSDRLTLSEPIQMLWALLKIRLLKD